MSRATRRDLMSAAGFTALVAVAAVAVVTPDAPAEGAVHRWAADDDEELIAIGREAVALLAQREPWVARYWALPSTGARQSSSYLSELDVVSAALKPIDDRLTELSDRALCLRANSRDALIAKAHLIRHEMFIGRASYGRAAMEEFQPDEQLTWSLLEDLLGEASLG